MAHAIALAKHFGNVAGLYARDSFVVLRNFISKEAAGTITEQAHRGCKTRVVQNAISWTEIGFAPGSLVHRIPELDEVKDLIRQATGHSGPYTSHTWANLYEAGEFIPWHRDSDGEIQLLLSLQSPPPARGGELLLGRPPKIAPLRLEPGDAVLFSARTLDHSTTALVPVPDGSAVQRLVASIRFYMT